MKFIIFFMILVFVLYIDFEIKLYEANRKMQEEVKELLNKRS